MLLSISHWMLAVQYFNAVFNLGLLLRGKDQDVESKSKALTIFTWLINGFFAVVIITLIVLTELRSFSKSLEVNENAYEAIYKTELVF